MSEGDETTRRSIGLLRVLDLADVELAAPFPGHSLARFWDPAAVIGPVDSPLFSHLARAGFVAGREAFEVVGQFAFITVAGG